MNHLDESLIEVPQTKSIVYKGKFLEFHRDTVVLPNGHTASREYLHHPGAIAAVPVLDDGTVVLVRQFRYPTGQALLEIPAGKLESGEEPEECVRRELREEIGYEPDTIIPLTSIWTTPGFTDEVIHLFCATGLKPCPGQPDPDEFLERVTLTRQELMEIITKPNLIDAKTIAALSLMELRKLWQGVGA